MHLLPLLGISALLFTGCYDSSFGESAPETPPGITTESIRELRDLYVGTTFVVTGDIRVSGVVTSSDAGKNFYRTLCIGQDGAGLELMAGLDHLHNDYPVGCRVTLRLQGLAVGLSYGVLQIGRPPQAGSGYATDYLASPAALGAVCTRNGETLQTVLPTTTTIGALTPDRCGTLVRIDGLHYTPEGLAEGTWVGYKRFTNDAGEEIFTYVRLYAAFADNDVPAGKCSLTGILQYDNGRYSLKIRDENDCAF